jgi:oxygen-independent coproporphyrinogen-3 oxidase
MNAFHLRDIPEEHIFALVEKFDTRGPRYTSYPTVPVWKPSFPARHYQEALRRLGEYGEPVAVYLHLPFCQRRCLYCGCNSYITQERERITNYVAAMLAEVDRVADEFAFPVRHGQLHLGGGTPTHTPPDLLAQLLDRVIERIPGAENAERSIEVDPRVTTDEQLTLLAERGFRRISAGLQDLNPQVQKAVRREYSFEQMAEFVQRARGFGFTSVNIDLIYGLPLQTRESWRETLVAVAKLKPDRLACFGYAHLPAKIKHQRAIHDTDLPPARERLGMLLDANRFFTAHGYDAIGMDHFALANDELAIARRGGQLWRNFMGYTTIRGLELLGLGCSGISEFRDLFVQNIVPPEVYAEAILDNRSVIDKGHALDFEDCVRKHIINHLMCNMEIELPFEAYVSANGLFDVLNAALESLQPYEDEGLLERRIGGYSITPLGQLFLRNLAMVFDRYLPLQTDVTFSRTV